MKFRVFLLVSFFGLLAWVAVNRGTDHNEWERVRRQLRDAPTKEAGVVCNALMLEERKGRFVPEDVAAVLPPRLLEPANGNDRTFIGACTAITAWHPRLLEEMWEPIFRGARDSLDGPSWGQLFMVLQITRCESMRLRTLLAALAKQGRTAPIRNIAAMTLEQSEPCVAARSREKATKK